MSDTALEALHVAAKAIQDMPGVLEAGADNDHKGGEIIFTTKDDGKTYILNLSEFEGE
jgi:hypothetical protein